MVGHSVFRFGKEICLWLQKQLFLDLVDFEWGVGLTFVLWLVLEAIFYFVVTHFMIPQLQKYRKPVPTEVPPIEFFMQILSVVDTLPNYSFKNYFEGFFHGSPLEDIHEDNLKSFLAWGMFGKSLLDLDDTERRGASELLTRIQEKYPEMKNIEPGFNGKVSHCAVTIEPVSHIHRPMILYFTNMLTEVLFNQICLIPAGFSFFEVEGLSYWYRKGDSSICKLPPFLILHGISPGWSIYYQLIRIFSTDPHRSILLVDLDAVKVKSMFFFMPSVQQFSTSVRAILRRHNIDKVSLVGHSFGSITTAWLVQQAPDIIYHITLLDPVSVLLFLPDAAAKLIYGVPKTWMQYFLYYFVAREITISYALRRNFVWHQNILWVENIPCNVGVVMGLAMEDEITNPPLQAVYLQNCQQARSRLATSNGKPVVCPLEVVCWDGFSHAQIMASPELLRKFYETVLDSERHCLKELQVKLKAK